MQNEKKSTFLEKIPIWLSSKTSIMIYMFLFFYLVVFALLSIVIPDINHLQPTATVQLILGNYTNVLSALGASIAAGGGVIIGSHVKKLHQKNEVLHKTVIDLHKKMDEISDKIKHIKHDPNN